MKKIYNRPCVDVLLFTTSSTILEGSPNDTDGNGQGYVGFDATDDNATDNDALTGGYREWDNIWGK